MNSSLIQAGNQYLARAGTGAFPEVTKEEVEQLKASADTEQTRLLIELLWETGARISEALDIYLSDINVPKATLKLRRLKRRKNRSSLFPGAWRTRYDFLPEA
jgi:site-specific recombinase XerD